MRYMNDSAADGITYEASSDYTNTDVSYLHLVVTITELPPLCGK
jgi:uncharacterized membrane-anchored protein YitT (DUF2179 family)